MRRFSVGTPTLIIAAGREKQITLLVSMSDMGIYHELTNK